MQPHDFTVIELTYVAGRSDKFYRGYLDQVNCQVFTQFGRNGSVGSWTERKTYGSVDEATEALRAIMAKKLAKGYQPAKSAVITFDAPPVEHELHTAVYRLRPDEIRSVYMTNAGRAARSGV